MLVVVIVAAPESPAIAAVFPASAEDITVVFRFIFTFISLG